MTAIGRLLPSTTGSFGSIPAGQDVPVHRSPSMQMTGQVGCQQVVKWDANAWSSQVQFLIIGPDNFSTVATGNTSKQSQRSRQTGGHQWVPFKVLPAATLCTAFHQIVFIGADGLPTVATGNTTHSQPTPGPHPGATVTACCHWQHFTAVQAT